MKWHSVESSNIAALGHDPDSNTLAVRFKSGGAVWHYGGVDADAFEALRNAESVGGHFHREIKTARDHRGELRYPGTKQEG